MGSSDKKQRAMSATESSETQRDKGSEEQKPKTRRGMLSEPDADE